MTAVPPKVSIHIVAYNQAAFIREAIDSALVQDYPNLEVVVADDASTDGTAAIIADYAKRYPANLVALLNTKNLGVTGNSNIGLKACSGDLIAFMGGDDVLLPGKIAAQVDWFSQSARRVLCGHQVEVFYDDGGRPPHPLSRQMAAGTGAGPIIRQLPFGATAVMVRRDRIPPQGFDPSLPTVSDHMLWVDVVRGDGEWGFVPGTFARYRQHGGNVTRDPFRHLDEVEHALDLMAERYPAFDEDVAYARTRRLLYDPGVELLDRRRKAEARSLFVRALRREPGFAKAWIRLAQSLF